MQFSESPILPAKVHPGLDAILCIFETPFANNPLDSDCIYFLYLKRMVKFSNEILDNFRPDIATEYTFWKY